MAREKRVIEIGVSIGQIVTVLTARKQKCTGPVIEQFRDMAGAVRTAIKTDTNCDGIEVGRIISICETLE